MPVIVAGLVTFALALAVLIRERASSIGLRYFFFAGTVGYYLFCAGVSYALVPRELSLLWDRVAHVGVVFIPTAISASTTALLGHGDRYRPAIIAATVLSSISAVLVIFTDLFITSNTRLSWGWYPLYGPAGLVFIGFFVIVTLWVLAVHLVEFRRVSVPIHRRRIGLSILALAVGMLGAVDFLPALGVRVYAFGFIPIAFFAVTMGVVIVRYRLVDITPQLAAGPILNTMQGAVIVTDLGGTIRVANRIARLWLTGLQRSLINQRLELVLEGRSERIGSEPSRPGATEPAVTTATLPLSNGQYEWTDAQGVIRMVEVAATPLMSGSEAIGTVFAAHDITPHKDTERALAELALHDALTGLPNRVLLFERIHQWIALCDRTKQELSLFFVDLDRFKDINDTLGHEAGDQVLRTVAKRLRETVRGSDTVSRIGGDEFVIVAGGLPSQVPVKRIEEKIVHAVEDPIAFGETSVSVGASVGIASYPGEDADPESLVRAADHRMYEVKNTRRRSS